MAAQRPLPPIPSRHQKHNAWPRPMVRPCCAAQLSPLPAKHRDRPAWPTKSRPARQPHVHRNSVFHRPNPTEWTSCHIVEHDLPDKSSWKRSPAHCTEKDEMPPQRPDRLIDAAAGLTRLKLKGFFFVLVRTPSSSRNRVELKRHAQEIGIAVVAQGTETSPTWRAGVPQALLFRSLIAGQRKTNAGPRNSALGVRLRKSAFCKAWQRNGRPTLILDVGRCWIFGRLHRANIRQPAHRDAMSPCVVMIDEVEKSLAGTSSGNGDSGVSARLFGRS